MVSLKKINPAPSRICSIDASTNSMAFAIFNDESLESVGKVNFVGKDTYHKLADAAKKIKGFFSHYQNIDAVVIEHTIYLNSAKTAADLALVQGGILSGITLNGVGDIKSINPIAWQTFLGNNRLNTAEKALLRTSSPGKSESWYKNNEREFRKQRTIDLVNSIYNKKIDDNDIADAVGVGHYAIHNWFKLS
jgi:Holliday junction resolvasome RuvABC endonuclease subunit